MADQKSIENVALDDRRIGLALKAAYELQELAEVVYERLEEGTYPGLRSICHRMERLSTIVMSVLDDELETTDSIEARLNGSGHEAEVQHGR